MKEQLEKRLEELQKEFGAGDAQLKELRNQALNLEQTLLRISGAAQVIREELDRNELENSTSDPIETVVSMPEFKAGKSGKEIYDE